MSNGDGTMEQAKPGEPVATPGAQMQPARDVIGVVSKATGGQKHRFEFLFNKPGPLQYEMRIGDPADAPTEPEFEVVGRELLLYAERGRAARFGRSAVERQMPAEETVGIRIWFKWSDPTPRIELNAKMLLTDAQLECAGRECVAIAWKLRMARLDQQMQVVTRRVG